MAAKKSSQGPEEKAVRCGGESSCGRFRRISPQIPRGRRKMVLLLSSARGLEDPDKRRNR